MNDWSTIYEACAAMHNYDPKRAEKLWHEFLLERRRLREAIVHLPSQPILTIRTKAA